MVSLKSNTVSVGTATAVIALSTFTLSGHTCANGDPVAFSGIVTGGLTLLLTCYVINADQPNGTFQVSLTPNGALNPLSGTTLTLTGITGGIRLGSGFNLGTTGILNTQGVTLAVVAASGDVVTLPRTTSDNLCVKIGGVGAANMVIVAPIADNGTRCSPS